MSSVDHQIIEWCLATYRGWSEFWQISFWLTIGHCLGLLQAWLQQPLLDRLEGWRLDRANREAERKAKEASFVDHRPL